VSTSNHLKKKFHGICTTATDYVLLSFVSNIQVELARKTGKFQNRTRTCPSVNVNRVCVVHPRACELNFPQFAGVLELDPDVTSLELELLLVTCAHIHNKTIILLVHKLQSKIHSFLPRSFYNQTISWLPPMATIPNLG
jgi:hypothetical protein